jgi:hypothetical protein
MYNRIFCIIINTSFGCITKVNGIFNELKVVSTWRKHQVSNRNRMAFTIILKRGEKYF